MRDVSLDLQIGTSAVVEFEGLALEALRCLALKRSAGVGKLNERVLFELVDQARGSAGFGASGTADVMARHGVPAEVLADLYIPEAARRLGRMWTEDQTSFANVTIATARLQSLAREMSRMWHADLGRSRARGSVLLIVPQGEQHTLGALILAGWLRRQGISVCHRIAPAATELSRLLSAGRFDGALLSVGSDARIPDACNVARALRGLTRGQLPIAAGGTVEDKNSLKDCVDLVTDDIAEALDFMGLRPSQAEAGATAMQ